jgi:copper ion binding protein
MKVIFCILVSVAFAAGACSSRQNPKAEETSVSLATVRDTTFKVEGMTCDDCEMSIEKGVKELKGIKLVEADHEDSTAHVAFDPSLTDREEIAKAIEKRGYKVVYR